MERQVFAGRQDELFEIADDVVGIRSTRRNESHRHSRRASRATQYVVQRDVSRQRDRNGRQVVFRRVVRPSIPQGDSRELLEFGILSAVERQRQLRPARDDFHDHASRVAAPIDPQPISQSDLMPVEQVANVESVPPAAGRTDRRPFAAPTRDANKRREISFRSEQLKRLEHGRLAAVVGAHQQVDSPQRGQFQMPKSTKAVDSQGFDHRVSSHSETSEARKRGVRIRSV